MQTDTLRPMKAADIMAMNVITTSPDETVRNAARSLVDHHISAMPVIDAKGELVGIVSEGDLMRRADIGTEKKRSWWLELFTSADAQAADYVRSHAVKVADVMSRRLVVVREDASLREIADLLEEKNVKRVPVLREGKLVGLVSRADLLRAYALSASPGQESVEDDLALREKVIAELKKVPGGMPWLLTVNVRNGVVELRGAADSDERRAALRVAAESTPGVKGVEDNLYKLSRYYESA